MDRTPTGTLIDVTVPLVPGRVPLYPGDTALEVERHQTLAQEGVNVSRLTCSAHCGTHVDAPVHFLDSAGGIETVPLDVLVGPCEVVDATAPEGHLDAPAVRSLEFPAGTRRVLLRTRGGALWDGPEFSEEFPGLTGDGAAALVERGVRLVGIDYLSVAPFDDPAPAHEVLLRAGVVVVEALDLRAVTPGAYSFTCLPLLVPGADGAPARAFLAPA
ncbi:cyclase family protein [Paenibacillus sp. TRM 82003]|uniref:cyclase family protein n=1 Tax=Kineococcus sp. TRM81007 TaxID=2925831 RepID=UPI001F5920E8|nr:cyclase family protein [Kineococcus sp. TRM81007]MCI2240295.1 cyclase family protein [Kineococcus sp. TRM81007]MCI3927527.1 cyclase family protein [Paenibacillus sp. TRM 82003]